MRKIAIHELKLLLWGGIFKRCYGHTKFSSVASYKIVSSLHNDSPEFRNEIIGAIVFITPDFFFTDVFRNLDFMMNVCQINKCTHTETFVRKSILLQYHDLL